MQEQRFRLREFTPELAGAFKEINQEWITKMFQLEPKDQRVLENPEATIIKTGGLILFVEVLGLGVVGTCALLKTGPGEYELTKMGVLEKARGTGAGKFLLQAILMKANSMQAQSVYLLTNKKCEVAIHLYEALGFQHDPAIMVRYGSEYARCDVAMSYRGDFKPNL
jgi:ribosomal protein S18 acetylase RimI-like enzyme